MKNSKALVYRSAEIEIVSFSATDVIATSYVSGDDLDSDAWDEV